MKARRFVVRTCDCDDYDDDGRPYFELGTAYDLSTNERPKRRSVSDAAHMAMSINATPRQPIGFHRPKA